MTTDLSPAYAQPVNKEQRVLIPKEHSLDNAHLWKFPYGLLSATEASDMVDKITVTLGLSTTDVASILGVTRQTIYTWSHGGEKQLEPDNSRRLRLVDKLAKYWRTLSEHSAKMALKIEFDHSESILAELQKETIHEDSIYRVMSTAAKYINEKKEKLVQETAKWARPEVSEADILTLDAFIPKPPKNDRY